MTRPLALAALGAAWLIGLGTQQMVFPPADASDPAWAAVKRINKHVNRIEYGAPYPQSPGLDGIWDCEDYALAKIAALERIGVPAVLLVVYRGAFDKDALHAVAVIERNGRQLVLDNATGMIVSLDERLRQGWEIVPGPEQIIMGGVR